MAAALAAPLLHGALVAHTHVPTHVQYSVYRALVANRTLAACWWRDGRLSPLPHSRRVQRRVRLAHRLQHTRVSLIILKVTRLQLWYKLTVRYLV